ncbi:MAG: hypothetical protein ACOVNY_13530 [Chitinophagaceae bacterium]
MFLVASAGFLYFYNEGPGMNQPRLLKHIAYVVWLSIIYGIGFWAIYQTKIAWLKTLWNYVYLLVFVILLAAGFYEMLIGSLHKKLNDLLANGRLFFQTPIPFLIITSFLVSNNQHKKTPINN